MGSSAEFTLGIEEEFQIIDPDTRELRCVVSELIESNTGLDEIKLQQELHQSMVEVATGICGGIQEARDHVRRNRRCLAALADRVGMKIGAASTHPFSRWQEQTITDSARYLELEDELQDVARANLIFGMHVHVGIPDRDEAIAVFNSARYFLPHVLALSTSSPFWGGRKTGLQSTRTLIFKRLPRSGIPGRFASYGAFERFVDTLLSSGCIRDNRQIWWDIRPHPTFSTLEFRVCDLPTEIDHVVAIAAVIQAIVAKLTRLHRQNLSFNVHRTDLMNENKWRAARYGVGGKLLDLGAGCEKRFADLAGELLDFVDDVLDDLGSREECEQILEIVERGTSADRQLAIYERTGGDYEAVVDDIVARTCAGL